ncbi:MAG TPA: hypothetical protein VGX52_15750 [Burkholderiales bacterium]|nr:hypothetical protein [Burkholderiales bacterium]
MKKLLLAAVLLFAFPASAALDVKDIALGAKEGDIKRRFPSVHCKALEWQSKAADRRCDDSRVSLGGVEVQVTFYLKKDALEAFDVRFDTRELDRFVAFLKSRYGAPQSENKDTYDRKDKSARQVYKALWESGKERAVLTAQLEKRRASMLVSRGDFDEEIYRVR